MFSDHINYIKESPLFDGINESDISIMLECMGGIIRQYRKGEIILLSNDEVKYVGVVLSGRIHMVKENPGGDETFLTMMRTGELFGESFVCREEALSFTTFTAAEHSQVLFVPFLKVFHICDNNCRFHQILMKNMVVMLSNKNVRLMEKIDASSQKTIREKILTYLRLQKKEQKTEWIELDLSRTALADYLGVNRSAMTRELAQMKQEGILDFDKNRYRLGN